MVIYGMNDTVRGRRNVCNERIAHKMDTLIKHVDRNVKKVIQEGITHLNNDEDSNNGNIRRKCGQ